MFGGKGGNREVFSATILCSLSALFHHFCLRKLKGREADVAEGN